jgi:hypothetical protein
VLKLLGFCEFTDVSGLSHFTRFDVLNENIRRMKRRCDSLVCEPFLRICFGIFVSEKKEISIMNCWIELVESYSAC